MKEIGVVSWKLPPCEMSCPITTFTVSYIIENIAIFSAPALQCRRAIAKHPVLVSACKMLRQILKSWSFKFFCMFTCILYLFIILIKPLTTKPYNSRASGDCGTSDDFFYCRGFRFLQTHFAHVWYKLCLQANIHSIMGSEDQVLNLMRLLDDGIGQAEHIEDKLDFYDNILQVGWLISICLSVRSVRLSISYATVGRRNQLGRTHWGQAGLLW